LSLNASADIPEEEEITHFEGDEVSRKIFRAFTSYQKKMTLDLSPSLPHLYERIAFPHAFGGVGGWVREASIGEVPNCRFEIVPKRDHTRVNVLNVLSTRRIANGEEIIHPRYPDERVSIPAVLPPPLSCSASSSLLAAPTQRPSPPSSRRDSVSR